MHVTLSSRYWTERSLGLEFGQNCVKITTKIAIFHKLPYCITSVPIPLFTLVTQLSKSVEKNLAYQGLLNFCYKHSMPLKGHAKWNLEHNLCHKQNKLLT